MLQRLTPALFVLLWSTGFIGSRLGAPDAEPFTFLAIRFFLVLLLLIPAAMLFGHRLRDWYQRLHGMVAGALLHGAYLSGVFWAIRHGMPAGVTALIVSLQPIATSVLAGPVLGEKVTSRHWAGLALGFVSAALIVSPKLQVSGGGLESSTIIASVLALAGITMGTLYQKRFGGKADLMANTVWQYAGALAVVATGSMLLETRIVNWTPQFIFSLGWLVLVLSIGAISLLMLLLRQRAVTSVSGLFYLVPAVTAVMAYAVFGETLNATQMVGLAMATAAVILTSW